MGGSCFWAVAFFGLSGGDRNRFVKLAGLIFCSVLLGLRNLCLAFAVFCLSGGGGNIICWARGGHWFGSRSRFLFERRQENVFDELEGLIFLFRAVGFRGFLSDFRSFYWRGGDEE